MFERLADIEKTYEELTAKLADQAVLADRKAYTDANRHISDLKPLVELYRAYASVARQLREAEEVLATTPKDDEMYALAEEELESLAGTGGDEATLFAGELFRMYSRYAEQQGWRVEVIDISESGVRGVKEVSAIVEGR